MDVHVLLSFPVVCREIDGPMLLSTLDINLYIQNQAVIMVNSSIPYIYFFTSRIECKRSFCQRNVNSISKLKKKKKSHEYKIIYNLKQVGKQPCLVLKL